MLKSLLQDITQLVFPALCAGCSKPLPPKQKTVCSLCQSQLPYVPITQAKANIVSQIFEGRIPVSLAFALYYFTKNSVMQNIMHQLKYKNNPDVGIWFGNQIAKKLITLPDFETNKPTIIVPVPSTQAAMRKRGYNQALLIAQGISQQLNIPISTQHLHRTQQSISQTHKTRIERLQNVSKNFEANQSQLSHMLIVDDVLTTGATLEACMQSFITTQSNSQYSIATAALAQA
jgi:ComF family protein